MPVPQPNPFLRAWYVDMARGDVSGAYKDGLYDVWPVRSGN